jgi:dTDP-4-dehydrorhamnose 3,5-epimerase
MQLIDTALPEVKIIITERIGDERGFFSEVWNRCSFSEIGIGASFVQDNHARSPATGTVRGLHYQLPPRAQGKLLRVTRGAIFDVAVDIRRGSPSFGHHVAIELSAANWRQLWIPAGFAHGYCVVEDDTEVQYKVSDFYSPAHERGLYWDDPALAIAWPVERPAAIVSARDRRHPVLAEQPELFDYIQ